MKKLLILLLLLPVVEALPPSPSAIVIIDYGTTLDRGERFLLYSDLESSNNLTTIWLNHNLSNIWVNDTFITIKDAPFIQSPAYYGNCSSVPSPVQHPCYYMALILNYSYVSPGFYRTFFADEDHTFFRARVCYNDTDNLTGCTPYIDIEESQSYTASGFVPQQTIEPLPDVVQVISSGGSFKDVLIAWNPTVAELLPSSLKSVAYSNTIDSFFLSLQDFTLLFFKYIFREPAVLIKPL
jgi:hypothetical protein